MLDPPFLCFMSLFSFKFYILSGPVLWQIFVKCITIISWGHDNPCTFILMKQYCIKCFDDWSLVNSLKKGQLKKCKCNSIMLISDCNA